MAVTDNIYDNWGNITITDVLYQDLPIRYELQTTAGTVEIEEPIGWNKVPFIHKRDKDRHGFNYEFTGTDFTLEFDNAAGEEDIDLEYKTYGNDGTVLFRRVIEYDGTDIVEYEGKLNLNTLKRVNYRYQCVVERKSLHELIKTRMSSKINIEKDSDLDGNPADNWAPVYLGLLGQRLTEKFDSEELVVRDEAYSETRTGNSVAFLLFDFQDPEVNTIRDFIGTGLGISGNRDSVNAGDFAIFDFQANGTYTFEVTLDYQVSVRINPRFLAFGKEINQAAIWTEMIVVHPTGEPTVYTIHEVPVWNPDLQGVTYPRVTATATFTDVPIVAGDKLQIIATVGYGHNARKLKSINVNVRQYKTKLKVRGSSTSEPTLHTAELIKQAAEKVLKRMTGLDDIFMSDFYSKMDEDHAVDGCGANRVILNGGDLRLAPPFTLPKTTTFQDMLNSLNAIDCIGMGYEWDATNEKEVIRVEPAEYFYKDVEVFEFEDTYDYQEETAKDLIYNKIRVGYDKFKEEEENSLDEIHAEHEYQTPIKSEANEYTAISKYLASGYLVETARRLSFEREENENEAGPYDDDIFIVHVHFPSPEVPLCFPVTEEPFSAVEGILDPETTINMTLTPKRMLMAHNRWLTSSLIYKDASQALRCTFVKQNRDFSTTLDSAYPCHRGDEARLPLRAGDDIILSVYGDFTGIYSPEWVNFKARVKMSDVRMIINAHRGLDPDGKNYGYLTFKNDKGVVCKGWLHELTYTRESQEVSFKLLKKKFP